MAEGEVLEGPRGADRVEVAAQTKDLGTLVGAEGVVEEQVEKARGDAEDTLEKETAKVVGGPLGPGEEAVESRVVLEARDARLHECGGDGVSVPSLDPAGKEDDEAKERGLGEGRAQGMKQVEEWIQGGRTGLWGRGDVLEDASSGRSTRRISYTRALAFSLARNGESRV
jgi:hypothetical protein